MKVAFITTVARSLRFLRGHIDFLNEKGVESHVIASPSPILKSIADELDVEATGVEMQRRISPLRDLVALWQLTRCLRRLRPDIVHAHTPKAGFLGMLAGVLAGVPIRLYHIHGLPLMTARGLKRRILRICDVVACSLANQVFCVSHSLAEVVHDERICGRSKLVVLANGTVDGIDADGQFNPKEIELNVRTALRRTFNIGEGERVIGFVGRIVTDKGIEELLLAFSQLRKQFTDLHLLLVGEFEGHQPISPVALEMLNADSHIHVVGFVENPAPYYSIMDILAFPTYREGFGLAAAEASAMEVPIVATRIPGCIDAVYDRATGTLVPPKDAKSLAIAIASYLQDPNLRRQHGVAGRQRMLRDFQPQPIREALWNYYLKCVDARRVTPPSSNEIVAAQHCGKAG